MVCSSVQVCVPRFSVLDVLGSNDKDLCVFTPRRIYFLFMLCLFITSDSARTWSRESEMSDEASFEELGIFIR